PRAPSAARARLPGVRPAGGRPPPSRRTRRQRSRRRGRRLSAGRARTRAAQATPRRSPKRRAVPTGTRPRSRRSPDDAPPARSEAAAARRWSAEERSLGPLRLAFAVRALGAASAELRRGAILAHAVDVQVDLLVVKGD